ncbi:hypothetical protein [Roseobacter sp.]|uniref:hypothetical protein n=1 Tax=Roseobacter sp. TaxID=1907202 RepID=UPI00296766E1|nr:hypothetical protein [Roseobacter sp.]MDW3181821.1 hypothetical protein [Roseobacter sp.]
MLAPLSEMLDERRPEQGLLDDIEAEIDARGLAAALGAPRGFGARALLLCFVLGAGTSASILAGHAAMTGPTHQIAVRPALKQSWLPLGAVSLEGKTLRRFVAAKCQEHSHLVIELSGYDASKNSEPFAADGAILDSLLMAPDEKILMTCNF